MTTLRTLIATLILTLASTPCFAKCPYEDKAKNLYRIGADSYAAKDFGRALYVFGKVQKLCPTIAMIYNLARVNDLAGNSDAALVMYQKYLKLKDPSATTVDIEKRVKTLRSKTTDWTNPFEGEDKPKADKPKAEKPKPCPQVPAQAVTLTETPRYKRPWAWVATGVGVALLGTGAALLATRRVDVWERNEDTGKLESITDSIVPGTVLLGAGAVAGGLGVWLFARGETVSVMPTGTGISVAGVF